MRPLTRADREFLLLASAFAAYGLMALVATLATGGHLAVALAAAAVCAPVFALASSSLTPAQTERFLAKAAPVPQHAARESTSGQVKRFVLASLLLALPLALGAVLVLVVLFDRLNPKLGSAVAGVAAGVFLGFGFGYLRLSLWMKKWQARAGTSVWREAWPRKRSAVSGMTTKRQHSLLVRYYLAPWSDSAAPADHAKQSSRSVARRASSSPSSRL